MQFMDTPAEILALTCAKFPVIAASRNARSAYDGFFSCVFSTKDPLDYAYRQNLHFLKQR